MKKGPKNQASKGLPTYNILTSYPDIIAALDLTREAGENYDLKHESINIKTLCDLVAWDTFCKCTGYTGLLHKASLGILLVRRCDTAEHM